MHIKSVEFAGAIGQIGQAAPELVTGMPQIAFSGRSNVGKSTLINHLLGRTRTPIARVSARPGKTQEINFFRVRSDAGDFALVDLPGYGFAQAPAPLRERWRSLTDEFLRRDDSLTGVVQLIDLRRGPTDDDRKAVDYLAGIGRPVLFALTKADKLKPRARREAIAATITTLGADESQVIACSSLTGDGMEELRETLGALLMSVTPQDRGDQGSAE
ncbi:MAG: ribosome biogenesis GTP-binding protein YihA/YsxC [Gemmatimonadota bacterium]|nr:ribosome biogenesis GTP-binding protein YihA/YsxC [Gemmatimonadota bacterium]